MSKFKVGDTVVRTGASIISEGMIKGKKYVVSSVTNASSDSEAIGLIGLRYGYHPVNFELAKTDTISPSYYLFPNGVWVRQISSYLSSNGGQAVQYIARSTRLDGNNKGEPVENLRKAIKFLEWEIERLESE